MRLDEYVWSKNPRGLHVKRALITPLDFTHWSKPHFGWAKLIPAGFEYVDDAQTFLSMGITPVVRIYVPRPGAMVFDANLRDLTMQYINAGVKWFEFYNEPNLYIEWPLGVNVDWRNFDGVVRPMVDNWMAWAEFIAGMGCYPGFTAFAEADPLELAAIRWMDAFLGYIKTAHFDRFRNLLSNGLYCATHPYVLNHYYQEIPGQGPTSARPPEQQNAREGGWHFEYPYDPICQANDPGRTIYGGTAKTPNGDPVGLTAMGRMFNERCGDIWGSEAVPVLGTEGGIYPFPRTADIKSYQQDNRYPPYTHESQAEGTLAMFEWITHYAPAWHFGVCLWKEDDYWEPGPAKATDRLIETPPLLRTVPPMEIMQGFGPGPVHGEPTYHMIVLAPGLEPQWFFDTARAYWNNFRPIVTGVWDLIDHIPYEQSLAATVIAPPDMVDSMTAAIRKKYPNVVFDLIIANGDLSNVAQIFNERVWANRQFG
ncbi:MAG: hypothetical protein ABI690_26625 [Chloroflexota bacterium]